MTVLAGGHQSCNAMSMKFPFLFPKHIHPPGSIILSPQAQTLATSMRGDEANLQPPIMHQRVSHYAKLSCGC